MRGKGMQQEISWMALRITPAHAGKRPANNCIISGIQDHPRACGEKKIRNEIDDIELGSPPRMRGKAIGANLLMGKQRITPAHAGKRLKKLWKIAVYKKPHVKFHLTFQRPNWSAYDPRDYPYTCREKTLSFATTPILQK